MNQEDVVAKEQETRPGHCKKSTSGPEDSLGRCDGRNLLRETQGFGWAEAASPWSFAGRWDSTPMAED